jgi:carboxylesterase type B
MSIAAHMLAFNGRNDNLFRGAIMESGAPTTGLYQSATSSEAQSTYNTVVSAAGCSSASNKLACLRSVSYTTLYGALENTSFALNAFFPSIDGGFVAQSPSKQILNGQYIKIPTIQGHNDDEGALFALGTDSNSDSDTRNFITSTFFPDPLTQAPGHFSRHPRSMHS